MRVVIIGWHKIYVSQIRTALNAINVLPNDILIVNNLEQKSLEQASSFKAECIIVNYTLTYEDAIKLFKINPDAHILYLSSELNQPFHQKLLAMGVEKVLSKPFPLSSLSMYFDELLEKLSSNDSDEFRISLVSEEAEIHEKPIEYNNEIQFLPSSENEDENIFVFNEDMNDEPLPLGPTFEIEDEDIIITPQVKNKAVEHPSISASRKVGNQPEYSEENFAIKLDTVEDDDFSISLEATSSNHYLNDDSETIQLSVQGDESQTEDASTTLKPRVKETNIYIKAPLNKFEEKSYYPHAATEDESIYAGLDHSKKSTKKQNHKSILNTLLSTFLRRKP